MNGALPRIRLRSSKSWNDKRTTRTSGQRRSSPKIANVGTSSDQGRHTWAFSGRRERVRPRGPGERPGVEVTAARGCESGSSGVLVRTGPCGDDDVGTAGPG